MEQTRFQRGWLLFESATIKLASGGSSTGRKSLLLIRSLILRSALPKDWHVYESAMTKQASGGTSTRLASMSSIRNLIPQIDLQRMQRFWMSILSALLMRRAI